MICRFYFVSLWKLTLSNTIHIMRTFLKITTLSAVLLMLVAGFVSCNEREDSTSPLKGTSWKLIGIVDVETGNLTILEPIDCLDRNEGLIACYQLIFSSHHSNNLFGYVAGMSLAGTYKVQDGSSIRVVAWAVTDHMPSQQEMLFYEILNSVHSFSLQRNTLRLYYNDKQNYLLFNQQ